MDVAGRFLEEWLISAIQLAIIMQERHYSTAPFL
jgi:hypothetical protein